jgi:hypothetical protein
MGLMEVLRYLQVTALIVATYGLAGVIFFGYTSKRICADRAKQVYDHKWLKKPIHAFLWRVL